MFSFRIPSHVQLAREQLEEAMRHALQHRANAELHMASAQEFASRAGMFEARAARLREYLKEQDPVRVPPPRPVPTAVPMPTIPPRELKP